MKYISPMLSTLADRPFSKDGWLYEIKFDGYRAIAHISKKGVLLYSRNYNKFNDSYPLLIDRLSKIKEEMILDGEIVAYDESGNARFQNLQNINTEKAKIDYIVFDILYYQGKNLKDLPLIKRKEILNKIFKKYPNIKLSNYIEKEGEKLFELAVKENLEGIMAKEMNSPYIEGRRTRYWLKLKNQKNEEAVIAGFTSPRGSRKYFGALILGQYKNGKLNFIGHTGTGFNEESLKDISNKLEPYIIDKSPFENKIPVNQPATWVEPKVVVQIKFSEWTKDGIMRQPVFIGLREDKTAKNVVKDKVISSKNIMKTKENNILKFTNRDKVYFPKIHITKGNVIDYYDKISNYILPYLKDRPESLNRHPNGINGKNFFHKNMTNKLPSFIKTEQIYSESNKENINYLICNNKESLLYLANLGCIEINPWNSRIQKLDYPDYLLIDIDPDDNPWSDVVKVTKEVKKILDEACQESYLKTSGKSGLHIYIPLGAKYHFDDVRNFSELISHIVNLRLPKITSLERNPLKRKNKIYLDYLQNRVGQTTASVYSLRPTPYATVSTPLKWSELNTRLNPNKFNIFTIHNRLKKVGDLWKPILKGKSNLKKAIKCLENNLINK